MTDTIAIPERLRHRPRDHRGFVVPFFVALAARRQAGE